MTPPKPTPPTESSSVPTLLGEQNREAEGIAGSPERQQTRTRPTSERLAGAAHAAVRQELSFFSGPLPPPEDLIKYNDVFPDCGKIIVEMAQKEQIHRHNTDNRRLDSDIITLAKRGQLIGGLLALVAVVGAIYLLANDKSITGLSVLGGVVLVFGGAFVYDRYQSRPSKESDEDQDESRKTQELRVVEPPTESED
jgi:uncharacterized membrane protein